MSTRFFVRGVPVPQGSLQSFAHAKTGAVVTPQVPKVIEWRGLIAFEARKHCTEVLTDGVMTELTFWFPRPKSHYGTGRNADVLKASAPRHKITPPDADKLERAVWDALKGIAFVDDAQVVDSHKSKVWAERGQEPGVYVWIGEAGEWIGGDR